MSAANLIPATQISWLEAPAKLIGEIFTLATVFRPLTACVVPPVLRLATWLACWWDGAFVSRASARAAPNRMLHHQQLWWHQIERTEALLWGCCEWSWRSRR
ncbi:hypothetical protein PVAP13_5KG222828 [Panicum virgatum]|uniref:Uncharacterized protein n=1 Tax=Panicum virgatum TaxID=38727 RepID=A0A8T0SKW6_PANVG|nr:hypothetical protein PVAP13_5KG222828 [Panicum virgatum]